MSEVHAYANSLQAWNANFMNPYSIYIIRIETRLLINIDYGSTALHNLICMYTCMWWMNIKEDMSTKFEQAFIVRSCPSQGQFKTIFVRKSLSFNVYNSNQPSSVKLVSTKQFFESIVYFGLFI